MEDLEEMLRELSEKYKNSKSVEVYEEDLEWWFKIIDDLREENKKLKSDLAFERTMLDNVKAEYKSLQNVIKKLKARIEIQKLNIQFFEKELDLYQKLHEKTLSAEWEQDLYEY